MMRRGRRDVPIDRQLVKMGRVAMTSALIGLALQCAFAIPLPPYGAKSGAAPVEVIALHEAMCPGDVCAQSPWAECFGAFSDRKHSVSGEKPYTFRRMHANRLCGAGLEPVQR